MHWLLSPASSTPVCHCSFQQWSHKSSCKLTPINSFLPNVTAQQPILLCALVATFATQYLLIRYLRVHSALSIFCRPLQKGGGEEKVLVAIHRLSLWPLNISSCSWLWSLLQWRCTVISVWFNLSGFTLQPGFRRVRVSFCLQRDNYSVVHISNDSLATTTLRFLRLDAQRMILSSALFPCDSHQHDDLTLPRLCPEMLPRQTQSLLCHFSFVNHFVCSHIVIHYSDIAFERTLSLTSTCM